MTAEEQSLEELRADAAYRRSRLALYRARIFALRGTSSSKLRELERASAGATERLERAERASQQPPPGDAA